jgi:hypothetical protein
MNRPNPHPSPGKDPSRLPSKFRIRTTIKLRQFKARTSLNLPLLRAEDTLRHLRPRHRTTCIQLQVSIATVYILNHVTGHRLNSGTVPEPFFEALGQ